MPAAFKRPEYHSGFFGKEDILLLRFGRVRRGSGIQGILLLSAGDFLAAALFRVPDAVVLVEDGHNEAENPAHAASDALFHHEALDIALGHEGKRDKDDELHQADDSEDGAGPAKGDGKLGYAGFLQAAEDAVILCHKQVGVPHHESDTDDDENNHDPGLGVTLLEALGHVIAEVGEEEVAGNEVEKHEIDGAHPHAKKFRAEGVVPVFQGNAGFALIFPDVETPSGDDRENDPAHDKSQKIHTTSKKLFCCAGRTKKRPRTSAARILQAQTPFAYKLGKK